MIRIIDTYNQLNSLFDNGIFNIEKWELYINRIYDNSAQLFKSDIAEYFKSRKYTFERDFLPVINSVSGNQKAEILHKSFSLVTQNLNEQILDHFGKELDVDIVLYLGLCNGAGWVTNINGYDTILLGIEKILELNWYDIDSMRGLIYHELGHIYQAQNGILKQTSDDNKKKFVWKLFTEGVAMYFEQMLVGDTDYFHQNINGWKSWCDKHSIEILKDFDNDLPTMNRNTQRFFGDWADYRGHKDIGYYLGAKFIYHLLKSHSFNEIINFNIDLVYDLYTDWQESYE